MSDPKTAAAAAARNRLVLCTCNICKSADKDGRGLMIEYWKKLNHENAQVSLTSSIRQRGRGRGSGQVARGTGLHGRGNTLRGRPVGGVAVRWNPKPDSTRQNSAREPDVECEGAGESPSGNGSHNAGTGSSDRERNVSQQPHEDDEYVPFHDDFPMDIDPPLPGPTSEPEDCEFERGPNVQVPGSTSETAAIADPIPTHLIPPSGHTNAPPSPIPPVPPVPPAPPAPPRARRARTTNSEPSRRSTRVSVPSRRLVESLQQREMSAERRTAADRANAGSSNNNLAAEDFSFDDAEEFEAALDVHDRDRDEDNDDSHQPADVNLPPPEDIPLAEPRRDAQEIYDTSHDIWFIRILLTLVAFLHTKYHVSFRACDILLSCLNIIFLSLKLIDENTQIPRNLGTVMKKLDLEDRFTNYPICHICHRIFKPNIPVNSVCPDCDTALFKATSPTIFQRVTGKAPPPPPPVSAAPIQVLSSLLVDFLAQPGIEAAAEKWKARTHEPGKYKDIMDGNIWKSSACADGTPFFDGSDESGELRLGVTLSLDWFGRKTSVYGPSHSSGAFSFSVSNLPAAIRYRAGNLLLAAMTPGPTEPTAEQLQHYLKILVDDLLKLYETGIKIITPSCPEGRLVRVVLLGIVCDHPAMCKLCGFADHGHDAAPCTKCSVTQFELFSDEALQNQFKLRDGDTHRRQCNEWNNLETPKERGDFFTKYGARWTELARLPYLDLVRCTVVDPMHNLLLGIVKNQWYGQWILQGALRKATTTHGRELDVIHQFLESFESPLWAGKLPLRVGEPAGGSLSADEYKLAAITVLPIIIPIVWDMYSEEANVDFQKAKLKWEDDKKEYEMAMALWESNAHQDAETGERTVQTGKKRKADGQPVPPKKPKVRMQDGEARNFLRLATALKILLSSSIDDEQLERAQILLEEYLLGFKELYGESAMKPNQAWAVHIVDQIRDFGPVYSFWTFVSERLNKLLKNFNSNGLKGGQMEISMMRSFGREKQLRTMIDSVSTSTENETVKAVMSKLSGPGLEARGTVEDAPSRTSIEDDAICEVRIHPGTIANASGSLSDSARACLFKYYNSGDTQRVRYALDRGPSTLPILSSNAQFYNYALLDGRRLTPMSRTLRKSAGSSIVCVPWEGRMFSGEVLKIFHHIQPGIESEPVLYVEMRWMKYLDLTAVEGDPWNDFPELQIEFWELNEYLPPGSEDAPPSVVPFRTIKCQLSRGIINTTEPSMWVTTSMARHAISSSDE